MEVFRIAETRFSRKLTSSGSPNRWNMAGEKVIYCGSSRSLSTLELIVHSSSIKPKKKYSVMVIHISDDDEVTTQVFLKNLPADWRTIAAYSSLQRIGSAWYQSLDSVVLKVPSAVIPHEYNYVINTEHPQFAKSVKHVGNEPYFWDERSGVK